MTQQTIVVIGNGMVGYKFIEKLTAHANAAAFRIVTFCEEPYPAYDRVHLSEYFSGKTVEDLSLASLDWYEEQGVELLLGERADAIDRERKVVVSNLGREIPYHKVIIATGSSAFVPPVPGVDKTGVFVYRTIDDLDAMIAYGQTKETAAVIGGGLLGLEAAKAMVDLGLKTHVVELAARLMPRQIDQPGSDCLRRKIEELGVRIHTEKMTHAFSGNGKVEGLQFADQSLLDVDMVVISAGIRPRDELARAAELEVGPRGGIVVDDHMLTSDPDIYAIGECALHNGMIYGLVAPGYRMAETAVAHLNRLTTTFTGSDMSTKLKLMGVDVASIGDSLANGHTSEAVTMLNSQTGIYKKLVIDPRSNTLKGAILVGDTAEYGQLLQMYLNSMPLPDAPESLIVQGGGGEALGIDKLPDSAQICSCENVLKCDLVDAIQDGHQTIPALKKCTKAGTGCGSCVPLMKDLLTNELEKMGVAIDKSLCAHFSHTRQELVQIVKATGITKFDELLGRFGNGGDGCEICKPTVASILATYHNDYILEHQTLQDTNDYYLANIQKNGTYSVVPRVPGGEIKPEQLIAIGEVAQEFNLYTKITGGQRIDLFGAHLQDLPTIWRKLNAVGLESGHAYAKGLRTVKSCVGQSWCRFGVDDSTGLAIELENRYKGIRFPHKVKMAVSGCARECAEAQCKDVGVIATENGWNLYVCGNGGMKPRHADLFATDLDKETLIRTIDRFLMYYARTADKLMRTAKWMDQLPDGLDHLRQVVMEDSLGLHAEFDQEIDHLISTYQDEWRTTTEDKDKLKRYQHFVNASGKDPNVTFDTVRSQPQPRIELPVLA